MLQYIKSLFRITKCIFVPLEIKPIIMSIINSTLSTLYTLCFYLLMACSSSDIPVSLNALFDSAKLKAIAL